MATDYVFLQRLGLGEDADARAIRRAYARELKLIDQERDPDAFQQLRASYETALDWAAWAANRAVPDAVPGPWAAPDDGPAQAPAQVPDQVPAQVPPHVPAQVPADALQAALALDAALAREAPGHGDAAPEPTPAELGSLVFETFVAGMPALARSRGELAEPAWYEALRAALDDERLLNFDARLCFEQALAHLLASGWRSGHEVLFPVAATVFGWDRDRRTLGRLGQAGRLLDLALEERAGFASQDAQTRAHQREALALVRLPEAVADRMILRLAPVLEQMAQRFPYWLPLIGPSDKIGQWRARHVEKGRPFEVVEPAMAPAAPARGIPHWLWMVVLAAGVFLANLGAGPAPPPAYDTGEVGQMIRQLVEPGPSAPDGAPVQPPPRERLEEIAGRIDYRPGTRPGPQRASFEVVLDRQGKVVGVDCKVHADDPAYTVAVEKAIRDSKPFPRLTARRFVLAYETAFSPAPRRHDGSLPAWARPSAPSPTPAPDVAPPKPAWPPPKAGAVDDQL